ncbi:MAG: PIN domain-containing protein [Anaerolineales bacterium]|nr:PIN domain-containing protein [Anaerolineales bacterium]
MNIYVDTSALYAILDSDDKNHQLATKAWKNLLNQETTLVAGNYVLLESFALVRHRLGLDALRTLQEVIVPILQIEWVNEELHQSGVAAQLTAASRKLSLVDCISFEIMRRNGIRRAFTFDRHFSQQGFDTIPSW